MLISTDILAIKCMKPVQCLQKKTVKMIPFECVIVLRIKQNTHLVVRIEQNTHKIYFQFKDRSEV